MYGRSPVLASPRVGRYNRPMWIFGVLVAAAIAACVCAIFFVGKEGPFSALSHVFEDGDKLYGGKGNTSLSDDLRRPRNENELLWRGRRQSPRDEKQ